MLIDRQTQEIEFSNSFDILLIQFQLWDLVLNVSLFMVKIVNFVFFTLSDNLFISNHICMFFNSLFLLADNCIMLQLLSTFTSNEHNVLAKFVSSANKMA